MPILRVFPSQPLAGQLYKQNIFLFLRSQLLKSSNWWDLYIVCFLLRSQVGFCKCDSLATTYVVIFWLRVMIIIALKGAIRDFLQSPHCSVNSQQQRTLKWHRRNCVQITWNIRRLSRAIYRVPRDTKGQLSYRFILLAEAINQWRRGGNGRKPLMTSLRYRLKKFGGDNAGEWGGKADCGSNEQRKAENQRREWIGRNNLELFLRSQGRSRWIFFIRPGSCVGLGSSMKRTLCKSMQTGQHWNDSFILSHEGTKGTCT